jgi:hypothetical protein
MCHDSATKLLSVFKKNEKRYKTKNLRILRFAGLPIFYGFLKRLKKLPFYFFTLLVGRAGFEL